MENTLHEGEHLIISSLFYTPQRGDIVVCEDYSSPHKKPIVKRIIEIVGDHVKVTKNGKVTLKGEVLEEEYVYVNGIVYENPVDLVVGEGEIFVMGDHRNMSDDSRSFGSIDEDSIIGKVLIRFYPFDKFGSVE
jgi:signal peptidase I